MSYLFLDMWILWAEHEMTVNHSPTNARQLFQRALRSNPQSKRLYTEVFKIGRYYQQVLIRIGDPQGGDIEGERETVGCQLRGGGSNPPPALG